MTGRILVVSDLDGTLLGDDAALVRFADWHDLYRDQILLVYSSGRSIESIRDSLADTRLPEPTAIVGCVGTEIRWLPQFQSPPDWPRVHSPSWSRERVLRALGGDGDLTLQDREFQSSWKVSYFYHHASVEQLERVRVRLESAGVAPEIVYSSNRDLDILPQGIDKGSAARFIARRLGIPKWRLIACGDSGNDASLFRLPGYGVIVGNAREELKRHATPRTYLAKTTFAAGVLEGLRYWLPKLMAESGVGSRNRLNRRQPASGTPCAGRGKPE